MKLPGCLKLQNQIVSSYQNQNKCTIFKYRHVFEEKKAKMQIIDLQLQPKQSKMCFVVDIFIANLHQDYSVIVVAKDFLKLNKDSNSRMNLI